MGLADTLLSALTPEDEQDRTRYECDRCGTKYDRPETPCKECGWDVLKPHD